VYDWSDRIVGDVKVKPDDARMRVRTAQHRGVQHPGQLDVRGVAGLAAGALDPGDALGVAADHRQRPDGPLLERVLLDDRPDGLVAPLDLLLGLAQPRQVEIASSIRG
jgi:hypothetical protein